MLVEIVLIIPSHSAFATGQSFQSHLLSLTIIVTIFERSAFPSDHVQLETSKFCTDSRTRSIYGPKLPM